jgi:hypothetical protein
MQMTDTVESPGTRWRRPSRRTTWVVAALVTACLVVAAPLAYHWWTHPDLLPDSATSVHWAPQPVDEAATAFAVLPPAATGRPVGLTWHGASAVLAENTGQAEITYSLCDTVQKPDPDIASWPVTDLIQICSAQHDLVDGTHLTYPNPRQLVLMTVTPTRPGAVHVTGVDVRYSLGARRLFQHGTDHVALDLRLTAR